MCSAGQVWLRSCVHSPMPESACEMEREQMLGRASRPGLGERAQGALAWSSKPRTPL